MTKPIKDSKKPLQEPSWWSRNWFYIVLISLAVTGVFSAFFVPPLIPGLTNDGNSVVSVRQGILAVLAGALTMLTLSETHRKNTYEKNRNERDHTRQVLAERRSRYARAVEQLADEKAAVRLGGIYTLVGLVDEWLADDALDLEEQQKEGQVIINNLCSYIRAPFLLVTKTEYLHADVDVAPANYVGDFVADQAMFREEQDVRRTIFAEISNRSSTFTKDKNGNVFVTPGAWSDFDFDFSWAPIFYPLSNLTIEKAIFSSAKFYGDANFLKTSFIQNVDFSQATFNGKAKFNGSKFAQEATFNEVVFNEVADFSDQGDVKTFFGGKASFNRAQFTHEANFNGATFASNVNFSRAYFLGNAYFTNEAYVTRDAPPLNTMKCSGVTFAGNASFRQATFVHSANFRETTFVRRANFQEVDFKDTAIFHDTVFTRKVDFGGTLFHSYANFNEATFKGSVGFNKATFTNAEPIFAAMCWHARFSALLDPQDYCFSVTKESKPIRCGTATLDGKSFIIPLGTVLFDPNSRDKNRRISKPAKPLDEPNNGKDDNPE